MRIFRIMISAFALPSFLYLWYLLLMESLRQVSCYQFITFFTLPLQNNIYPGLELWYESNCSANIRLVIFVNTDKRRKYNVYSFDDLIHLYIDNRVCWFNFGSCPRATSLVNCATFYRNKWSNHVMQWPL